MDIVGITEQILLKIKELDLIRKEIRQRGEDKAVAESNYDKKVASVLFGLKNGKEYTLDEKTIKEPPASIMEKLARGICYQEKQDMELADAMYKSVISNLTAVMAQLSALQTINRNLD